MRRDYNTHFTGLLHGSNEIVYESGTVNYKMLCKHKILPFFALFPLGSSVSLVLWFSKTLGYNPNLEELSQ